MSKGLVLLTGASGHLGFRTLVFALEAGYRIRAPLRGLAKAEVLKQKPSLKQHLDSIEWVEVPDITTPDAYMEVIKGLDAVLHIAAPLPHAFQEGSNNNWRELLYDPAEKSLMSILNAAVTEPKVKKVVITYSIAVQPIEPLPGKLTVGPYDIRPIPDEQTLQNFPFAFLAYAGSNSLKYAAALKFCSENSIGFELVNIMSGYIQGRNELYTSAEQMENSSTSGSNEGVMYTALGKSLGIPRLTHQVFLDDVAKAHVVSLEKGKHLDNFIIAGNKGQGIPWPEVIPVIERLYPDAVAKGIFTPKSDSPNRVVHYDVSSSEEALGFEFTDIETMVKSVLDQYLELIEEKKAYGKQID